MVGAAFPPAVFLSDLTLMWKLLYGLFYIFAKLAEDGYSYGVRGGDSLSNGSISLLVSLDFTAGCLYFI